MGKRILQSLLILAVNLALSGLVLASFLLFLFRGDPILAAVPAVFALPVVILQPWFIVLFFLPYGPLLAPALTTAISVTIYGLLERKGKLDQTKRILARIRNRRTLVIACATTGLLLLVAYARYVDFPAMHRGVPPPLQYLTRDTDLTLASPRYYTLASFIDSEWLWQACLSEEDVAALADKMGMRMMAVDQIGEHYQSMPPYWWRPVVSNEVRILATPDFPSDGRGLDGLHAMATWNPEDGVLHMWIKDNF